MGLKDTYRQKLAQARLYLQQQNIWNLLLAVALGLLVTTLIYYWRMLNGSDSDFGAHLLFTRRLLQGRWSEIPPLNLGHPGLQLLMAALYWLTLHKLPLDLMLALILGGAQALSVGVVYLWIGRQERPYWDLQRAAIALGLILAAPVMLLTLADGQNYYGYIGLANYHNPTVILLRPLAIFSFLIAGRALQTPSSPAWIHWLAGGLMLFSALIKPNYALVILPALAVFAAWAWLRKQPIDWRLLCWGFWLPGGLCLAAQWAAIFLLPGEGSGGIIFRPLAVEAYFSTNLPWKFLLSIIFPLVVLAFNGRRAWQDIPTRLAALAFLLGAAQMYLLAEGGARLPDGNFRWGAQIGLYLLFAALARFGLLHSTGKLARLGFWLAFGAHLAAGLWYYYACFVNQGYG